MKIFMLCLAVVLFAITSCSKKNPESELPAVTQTGANTMGFLANGQARSTTGKPNSVNATGVDYNHYGDSTVYLSALTSSSPRFSLSVRF